MNFVLVALFFVFGTIVGSFLNVVIFRMNTSRSLGGRSACMSCVKKLSWYELIPILSFVFQGGRCRGCKTKISKQYPTVEFVTGVLFAGLFCKFSDLFWQAPHVFLGYYVYFGLLFSTLIVISVYDFRHKIIPDQLSLFLGVVAFLGLFVFQARGLAFGLPNLWDVLVPIIVASVFGSMWLLSRGAWMGLGDAKLVLGLGFMLGFKMFLSAVALSFWIGATVGLVLISVKKLRGLKSEMPFAPFLVLGSLIAFFFDLNLFLFF